MLDTPRWAWIAFVATLSVLLALDLFLHRGHRETSRRAATWWSVVWVVVGLAFGGLVWIAHDRERATEYLAAYTIEKSLSLDNLFVFLIVFKTLRIPTENQRTALSWGVFGALAFRGVFIFLGAAVLERWDWVAYVFGAILLVAAWRAFLGVPKEDQENALVGFLSRHLPVSKSERCDRFFVREDGRRRVTPLFLSVLALETTDVVFAIDSVPAALAVSREEFVVYSSNAFAILGLRSLYLVMAHTIAEMRYLHYGLAGVLAFAAFKLLAADWIHVPARLSVAILLALIGTAVGASLRARRREQRRARDGRRLSHSRRHARGGAFFVWILTIGVLLSLPIAFGFADELHSWSRRNVAAHPISVLAPALIAGLIGLLAAVCIARPIWHRERGRDGHALAVSAGLQSMAGIAVSVFVLASALLGVCGSRENEFLRAGHASISALFLTAPLVLVQIAAFFARARSRSYGELQLLAFLAWLAGPAAILNLAGRWLF